VFFSHDKLFSCLVTLSLYALPYPKLVKAFEGPFEYPTMYAKIYHLIDINYEVMYDSYQFFDSICPLTIKHQTLNDFHLGLIPLPLMRIAAYCV
jgi:hypothetical protein